MLAVTVCGTIWMKVGRQMLNCI